MPANPNLDKALSLAIPRWVNEFKDNICNVTPFLKAMRSLGGVVVQPGGREIVMPVRYQGINISVVTNPGDSAYDSMSGKEDDTISGVSFQWAELYGSMWVAEQQINLLRNEPERLGMYIQGVVRNAVEDFGRFINSQVLGNTDTGDSTKLGGLPYYISDYATAVGSYAANSAKPLGGVSNSSASHWWNAIVATSVGAIAFSVLDTYIARIFATTGVTPTLAVMPSNLYSKLRSSAMTVQAINQQGGKATVGFNAIAYGDTLIIPDEATPSGTVFLLTPDTVQLYIDTLNIRAEEVPVRQPVRFWKMTPHVQLTCNGRKYNAKLLGVTT
jgi:hypothetical protein